MSFIVRILDNKSGATSQIINIDTSLEIRPGWFHKGPHLIVTRQPLRGKGDELINTDLDINITGDLIISTLDGTVIETITLEDLKSRRQ